MACLRRGIHGYLIEGVIVICDLTNMGYGLRYKCLEMTQWRFNRKFARRLDDSEMGAEGTEHLNRMRQRT